MNIYNLNPWLALILASIFEIVWAILLRYSNGLSIKLPAFGSITFAILSFIFLSISVRKIEIGVAYAIWTGTGVIGTMLVSIILLREGLSTPQIIYITLIAFAVSGLFFTANSH